MTNRNTKDIIHTKGQVTYGYAISKVNHICQEDNQMNIFCTVDGDALFVIKIYLNEKRGEHNKDITGWIIMVDWEESGREREWDGKGRGMEKRGDEGVIK